MPRNTRAQMVEYPQAVNLPCCVIRGLWWLHYGHRSDMKTYGGCAAGILPHTQSNGQDINLSEVQKVASLRGKGHFERSHSSCRAGL